MTAVTTSLRSGRLCVGGTIRCCPAALTGIQASRHKRDDLIEKCLTKAGLHNQVPDPLRHCGALPGWPAAGMVHRAVAGVRPGVLLRDEPWALDPTSTRRITQTITELAHEGPS